MNISAYFSVVGIMEFVSLLFALYRARSVTARRYTCGGVLSPCFRHLHGCCAVHVQVEIGGWQFRFLEQLVKPDWDFGIVCCRDVLCIAYSLCEYRLLFHEPLYRGAVEKCETACHWISCFLDVGIVGVRIPVDMDAQLVRRWYSYPRVARRSQVLQEPLHHLPMSLGGFVKGAG